MDMDTLEFVMVVAVLGIMAAYSYIKYYEEKESNRRLIRNNMRLEIENYNLQKRMGNVIQFPQNNQHEHATSWLLGHIKGPK